MKKQLLAITIGLIASATLHASDDNVLREAITIDGKTSIVDVFLARNHDDSTIRKGSFHLPIGNNKGSSSSAPSGGGGGAGWVTASPLTSSWAFYSKDYPNGWTPAAYHQKLDFVQSTIPVITEDQYTQAREYSAATSTYRNVGTPVRNTRTYNAPSESRTVYVTSGSPYAGSYTNCTAWTPDASTVNSGQNFSQSRNCDFTWYQVYTFSIGGGWTDSWPGNANFNQSATGTKGVASSSAASSVASSAASSAASSVVNDWVTAASTATTWTSYNTTYSAWTPDTATWPYFINFDQTRTKTSQEESYTQSREYSPSTNTYRNVGAPVRATRNTTSTETRNITVSGGVTDIGPHTSCTGWTPAASDVPIGQSFTQTNSCNSTEKIVMSFKVTSTGQDLGTTTTTRSTYVDFVGYTQNVKYNESRTAVGTWNWACWLCN